MLSIACVPLFGQTGLGSSTAVPLEPVVDRKALADDVVSILGGEVARQPEDPAVLQRLKQVILPGAANPPETEYLEDNRRYG